MLRDKNGRFSKNQKVEIDIPSISVMLKYFIILFILAPWVYLILYKFDIKEIIENGFSKLFGPIDCSCSCPSPDKPY